jgi:hypothetical protein
MRVSPRLTRSAAGRPVLVWTIGPSWQTFDRFDRTPSEGQGFPSRALQAAAPRPQDNPDQLNPRGPAKLPPSLGLLSVPATGLVGGPRERRPARGCARAPARSWGRVDGPRPSSQPEASEASAGTQVSAARAASAKARPAAQMPTLHPLFGRAGPCGPPSAPQRPPPARREPTAPGPVFDLERRWIGCGRFRPRTPHAPPIPAEISPLVLLPGGVLGITLEGQARIAAPRAGGLTDGRTGLSWFASRDDADRLP